MRKAVTYIRVSTAQQGRSGLGLEAQKQAVASFLSEGDWEQLDEFVEIETGKGSNALDRRPQLKAALARCRAIDAVLVIAKLDRLARNVHFLSGLIEAGVEFQACDMPSANRFTLHIMAAVGEHEREMISQRTKSALAAAKARGKVLGTPANLLPNVELRRADAAKFANRLSGVLESMRAAGKSQRAMVSELNSLGVLAPRGGNWSLVQLQRILTKQSK